MTRFLGSHEIKAGLEYETETAEVVKRYSGGQQIDVFANAANPARPVYSHFYWTTPTATIGNAPVSALLASPEHNVTTVFLQDRWAATDHLTLNVGVRWDRQEIIDAAGTRQIDLKDDFAPRLGFIWDPKADGSSKVFGSYGQYYEQIPMDLVIRSFSFERQARIFNYSPTSTAPDPQAEADLGQESAIFGGFTEPVDPDLGNQYINEALLGYEYMARPAVAVGVKAIYRDYGEVIEDFLCADDGTYCIGNPGKGIMDRVFTLDYANTFEAPEPERVFKGVQLDVHKRLARSWQGMAEGRTPDTYEADLHFGYPVDVGPATVNLLLDVFNVLNAQRPVLIDQRWGFQEADNSSPTPVNPGYRKPVLRTPPTSFRLGVRVGF